MEYQIETVASNSAGASALVYKALHEIRSNSTDNKRDSRFTVFRLGEMRSGFRQGKLRIPYSQIDLMFSEDR